MRVNFLLRVFLMFIFEGLSLLVMLRQVWVRKRLRKKWSTFDLSSPPKSYDELVPKIEATYQAMNQTRFWAKTSGTRKEPKKIPYDRKRIKSIQRCYMESMMILTQPLSGLKTFFVFASLESDQSLTAGLVSEQKTPGRLSLLQAPYRYLYTPAGKSLILLSGLTAARLILIVATRPRFLYSTNPSTLVHFLDELRQNWLQVKAGISALFHHPKRREEILRLADGDALKRLEHLLLLEAAPESHILFEKLQAVITWDGGYVSAFLGRLRHQLPSAVRILPMYSMSTEALETIPHRIAGQCVYGPFQEQAFPEFQTLDKAQILKPHELKSGESYTLLITDHYGLERYDTEDIFEVARLVEGYPDLRFVRRRTVTASLTGEKVTEEQARLLFDELRAQFPILTSAFLSLFPVTLDSPYRYCLAIIGAEPPQDLSVSAETILCSLNSEYQDKVRSGRLGALMVRKLDINQLAKLMGQDRRWESQFKLMPLYERPVVQPF